MPDHALIVEIGSFLGVSSVLLAGGRKLRGSGKVHCIDPFDASGDAFSEPIYKAIGQQRRGSLRHQFDANIRSARLSQWVHVHEGRAHQIAAQWHRPIDMVFLDGDQSPDGVRLAYESWAPFLKSGGIIAVHNSRSGKQYEEHHDGHMRLVEETIIPQYTEVRCIGSTTFGRKP